MIKNTHFKPLWCIFLVIAVLFIVQIQVGVGWTEALNVSLISYYPADQTSGNLLDARGSTDIAETGTVGFTSDGIFDNARGVFASANYFKGATNASLDMDTSSIWSISAWYNVTPSSADRTIIHMDDIADSGELVVKLKVVDNKLYAQVFQRGGSVQTWTDTVNVSFNTWNNVIMVHNASGGNFYVYNNGLLKVNMGSLAGGANPVVAMSVGQGYDSDAPMVNGYVDDIHLWNRDLSEAQIEDIFGFGQPPSLSITLNSPSNNTNITTTKQFDATVSPATYNLTNATFYMWYSSNGTLFNTTTNNSLSGDSSVNVSFNILNIPIETTMLWNVYGCQGNGNGTNCSFAADNFTVTARKITEENQDYNSQVPEGTLQTFKINVSISSGFALSSGDLIYNGSSYAGSFSAINSLLYEFTSSITLPSVTNDTNVSFYWDITLTDDSEFISITNNQTVLNLGIDNCSSFTIAIFNFTLVDEETQVKLNGTADNTSIKVDIDLYSSSTATIPVIEFFSFYNETNPIAICISDALNQSNYYIDAQVEYDADGYAHEFYNIQNYVLNGTSNPSQNITLYDLKDADAQTFKISYKDESFLAVGGALIQIQRKYIEEGVFKTVEIPKTDSKGETIGQLVLNNVIYSFTIVKDGIVLAVFDNVFAVCQNPSISECEINLNSFSSTIKATDFYTSEDFAFTLDYDKLTRTITSVFSIPSGAVSTVSLNVTKEDALGTSVCSESVTTSAGTLTCVVGNNFGNGTVIAKLYSNGVLKGQGQINLSQSPIDIYGGSLIFLGLLIMLTLVGTGLTDNPVLTAIFLIVGVVLLFALNLVAHNGFIGATATILWLIVAVILIIIKGSKRT